ncbi:hypothetical protein LSAT2_023025, partial [Lamellibrachia satsuma]
MQFAVQLVFVISRNIPLQPTVTMTRLMLILALCLLGLWAASLAEETAQTEQVDDGAGSERQARGTHYVEFVTGRGYRWSFPVTTSNGSHTRRRVDAVFGVGDTPATSKRHGWT